jgi:hypothetical protein
LDDFYRESGKYKIASVNNHALELKKLNTDFRMTRFVRDPRDLVVSGYFYHKRGAEPWCNIVNPTHDDWKVVNGCVPRNMSQGLSFSAYLQSLDKEEGLIAEIDFRNNHFESMLHWPTEDSRIKVVRYEDLIGNECEIFSEIFSFYELSWPERKLGLFLANQFSARKQTGKTQHIRNSRTSQWKEHFTPKVSDYFDQRFEKILKRHDYE